MQQGYRKAPPLFVRLAGWLNLETMITGGGALVILGVADLAAMFTAWNSKQLTHADSVFPVVLGAVLLSLGAQTILGGFLLAIIGGNEAQFIQAPEQTEG